LRFMDEQGQLLTSFVHAHGVKRLKRKGPWSEFLHGEAFVRVDRTINVGGKLELSSEFWLREEDFANLGGVDRTELESNLRELLLQRLHLPTLRVDQWIRFAPPTAAAVRALGLDPEAPSFLMELRGYTLSDKPLYYQVVCGGPFAERLVIVR
jgi:GntR family transcriptional regulator